MPHLDPPPVPPLLNPSTAIPCANVLKECLPCDDDPIANFTAEGPDSDRFSFIFRAHVTPPLGTIIGDVDRPGFCYSTVSQQDAEDCAREDAEENLVTQPPYHGITIYHNTVQSCTGSCPDGSPFTYTVPAGTVVAFTQLEADQRAFGLACQRARTNKVCILTTALNTGCSGSAYNMTLKGLGGTPFFVSWYQLPYLEECVGEVTIGSQFPYIWWITHGELPDGLTLHSCSGVIDGTPTEIGDFPITLRATDATGAYMEKNLTLRVAEITNDSPLADGSVGAAYLVNFSTSIGDQEQQTWTVVAGTLPSGLTLSTAGVLSGTPTADGVSNFTVKVVETGSTGFTCQKAFSLTVNSTLPTFYWTLDNTMFDSVQARELNAGVDTYGTGIINNGFRFSSAGTPRQVETNTDLSYTQGDDFSFSFWINWAALLDANDSAIIKFDDGTINGPPSITVQFLQILGVPSIRFEVENLSIDSTVDTPFTPVLGQWYFFTVVYDAATGIAVLYRDTVAVLTTTPIILPTVAANRIAFWSISNFGFTFDYVVDETGWWLDHKLTASEIAFLYNSGSANRPAGI